MMSVLVDLPLTVVGDRVGLVFVVFCVLVAGREGFDVYKGFLVDERADAAEAATVEGEVSAVMRCRALWVPVGVFSSRSWKSR